MPTEVIPNYKLISLKLIDPSKTNPRKDFGDLTELSASIKLQGVIEPLIVRPLGKRFEIVAGERRYRASKLAELDLVPCLTRTISDADAIEIQATENIQRKDLKPLEEAAQYRLLIDTKPDKHSATTIALSIGKSPQWVWDVMKLLDLILPAKKLLDRGLMSINHAIPIARQTPADQEKIIHPTNGGLFTHDQAFNFGNGHRDKEDIYSEVKPRSVRELNAWIDDHIRFIPKKAAVAAPMLFDETAAKVAEAESKEGRGKKVIPISRDFMLKDSAKTGEERTYCVTAWKRADGTKGTTHVYPNKLKDSPKCEHSIMGVVVAGPGRGEAFDVCIAREKCTVHWGEVVRAKAKREKEKASGAKGKAKVSTEDKWERDQRLQREQRQRDETMYAAVITPLRKAVAEKLDSLTDKLPKALFAKLLSSQGLPKDTKPAQLAQVLIRRQVNSELRNNWIGSLPGQKEWAQALGVNVQKIQADAKASLKAKQVQTSGEKK